MKRTIIFRADASQSIGYGHFVRTLALADMLKDHFDCVFYTQTPSDYQKQELAKVCSYVSLPSDDSKFSKFVNALKGDEIVVLDNYFFTQEYEKEIRAKGAKVVLIDNLHRKHSCADAVIGFALGLEDKFYSVEPYTRLFIGTKYSLLRASFIERLGKLHKPLTDKPLNVLISFGGADKYGLSGEFVQKLYHLDNIKSINVVCGDASTNKRESYPKVTYHSRLSAAEMCDLFVENDIAILPSSTTALEALACGIKILGGYFVDNQIDGYNQYVKHHAFTGFGDFLIKENIDSLVAYIERKDYLNDNKRIEVIPKTVKENIISIFKEL